MIIVQIIYCVIKINKRNENEFLTSNLFLEIGSITHLEIDLTIDAIIWKSILKLRICSERYRRRTIRLCACLVQYEMQLLVFIVKKNSATGLAHTCRPIMTTWRTILTICFYVLTILALQTIVSHFPAACGISFGKTNIALANNGLFSRHYSL